MLSKNNSVSNVEYRRLTQSVSIVDVLASKNNLVKFKKVKRFEVRLPRSEGEKIIRKRERLLKKYEEEKFNQRSLEAFSRLFELNSASNTYILRSGYED